MTKSGRSARTMATGALLTWSAKSGRCRRFRCCQHHYLHRRPHQHARMRLHHQSAHGVSPFPSPVKALPHCHAERVHSPHPPAHHHPSFRLPSLYAHPHPHPGHSARHCGRCQDPYHPQSA